MAVFIACFVFFLAMTSYSDASYCLCNSGVSDQQLQKSIDYACGAGADCSQILPTGPCYSPNTVKDHCNYAVNSYYQKKGQVTGSCNFSGTATVSQTAPNAASGCIYPSSPSNVGTPSTNSSSSSSTGSATSTTTTSTPNLGLGPSGNGLTNSPDSGIETLHCNLLTTLAATLLLSVLICLRF